jgi:putative hydrolase of the HAD superfamily
VDVDYTQGPYRQPTLALDIGGVFFLGKADTAFFERWAKQATLDLQTLRQLLWYGPDIEQANIGEISAETYFERTALRLNTNVETIRAVIEDAYVGAVNEDLIAYTRQLKTRVRITALTNNWSFGRALMDRHGITDLFEMVINSAEVGVKKPHAGIYQIMLERLKVPASEVIFVDDTLENIEAAQALGIGTIHYQSTEQTITELSRIFR